MPLDGNRLHRHSAALQATCQAMISCIAQCVCSCEDSRATACVAGVVEDAGPRLTSHVGLASVPAQGEAAVTCLSLQATDQMLAPAICNLQL